MTLPRTTVDVLTDHVTFEIECVDRMYLNVYVPSLQYPKGLIGYLRARLGCPIASTAPLGGRERVSVDRRDDRRGQPLLLLLRGPGLRAVFRHVLRLLPLHGEVVRERARVGETPGRACRDRVHRGGHRVRRG